MDSPVSGERQRLKTEVEYRERNEGYGGALSALVGFSANEYGTPTVDASAFVRLSPELRLVAEFSDIAAALDGKDGRTRWAPYLANGFRASVRLLISL